jgi:hypothetical protein
MADWTKTDAANRALEAIGVLATGQAPRAEDTVRAEEIVQSTYEILRAKGLAPFPITAIPEWSQPMIRDIIGYRLAGPFGLMGQSYVEWRARAREAEIDLTEQCAGYVHPVPAKGIYF